MQLGVERVGDRHVELAVLDAEREHVERVGLVLGDHPGRFGIGRVLADVDDRDAGLLTDGAGERDLVEEAVGDQRLAEPAGGRTLDRVLDRLAGHPAVGDEDVAEAGPRRVGRDVRLEAGGAAEGGGGRGRACASAPLPSPPSRRARRSQRTTANAPADLAILTAMCPALSPEENPGRKGYSKE